LIDEGEAVVLDAQVELLGELATCKWVELHQNVVITGMTGVGKTYLGCSLAQQTSRRGYRVLYRPCRWKLRPFPGSPGQDRGILFFRVSWHRPPSVTRWGVASRILPLRACATVQRAQWRRPFTRSVGGRRLPELLSDRPTVQEPLQQDAAPRATGGPAVARFWWVMLEALLRRRCIRPAGSRRTFRLCRFPQKYSRTHLRAYRSSMDQCILPQKHS
jgi:hypothetical protein